MKLIKRVNLILNAAYLLMGLLFIFDVLTNLEISNQVLRSLVYYTILFATPLLLTWNLIVSANYRILTTILPLLMLTLVLTMGFSRLLSNINTWETQVILYQNKHSKLVTIEYQTKNIGDFNYEQRKVRVSHLLGLFMVVHQAPKEIDLENEWTPFNKITN